MPPRSEAMQVSEQIQVSGRVIAVRAVEDGLRFAVTVGPSPQLFLFFVDTKPPKLGQKIAVAGTVANVAEIGSPTVPCLLTTLSRASYDVTDEQTVRPVPEAWLRRITTVMRRPLYRYQVLGAGWLCDLLASGSGAILGDDPGLGKSAQAVAAVCATNAYPTIVVCPSSLKPHWEREFSWSTSSPSVHIISHVRGALPSAQIYVVNYSLLRHRETELAELKPSLYVLDEAQNLKQPKAYGKHQAAVATRLVCASRGAILLTGTPVMNRPSELWRLLHLCNPKRWSSFADFRAKFLAAPKGKEVGRSIRTMAGKVERLDELHAAISPYLLRRLKKDVLPDLPPKSRRSLLVRLPDQDLLHYERAKQNVVSWLRGLGMQGRATSASRAESIVRLGVLRRIVAIGKLRRAVPEYLRAWFSGSRAPLVVFAYHRDVLLGIWKLCHALGLRTTGIGGGESAEKRQRNVDLFQSGQADVFVAPILTAGVGLNLQRAADALFCERVWTPSGMLQCEDRIWRIGQRRPVSVTYIDAEGTVDEHVAALVEQKQKLIDAVVDDREYSESVETVIRLTERLLAE